MFVQFLIVRQAGRATGVFVIHWMMSFFPELKEHSVASPLCRCYSSVGNQHVGKQRLSIGKNCDRLGTVEHEFLHALGFWHEQSRADRDDYVNIMWDRIEPGNTGL